MRNWYLAPAALLLGGVLGLPLASTLVAGLGQYGEVWRDPALPQVALTTIAFAVVSVAIELGLGLVFALALDATLRLRGLLRAVALLPWALPSAVMAMAWRWIFNDTYGVAGQLALELGVADEPVAWLGRPLTAFAAIVIADVWKTTPFVTLILLAGLQSVPRELHEALAIDGAGPIRRFWWLTLPLLRPALAVALVFRLIQAIGIFDIVWVMTGGGPADATRTVALYIYDNVFRFVRPGYGAALTVVTAIVMFGAAAAAGLLVRGRVATGAARST